MSRFDDFNARVERTKEEADRGAAPTSTNRGGHTDPHGSGFGSTFFSVLGGFMRDLLSDFLMRVMWFFLLVGAGSGFLMYSFGIGFVAAVTLALIASVGFVYVTTMLLLS